MRARESRKQSTASLVSLVIGVLVLAAMLFLVVRQEGTRALLDEQAGRLARIEAQLASAAQLSAAQPTSSAPMEEALHAVQSEVSAMRSDLVALEAQMQEAIFRQQEQPLQSEPPGPAAQPPPATP